MTNLKNKQVSNIIKNYNIGSLKNQRLIYNFWNEVYKIKTTKGDYILKELKHTTIKMVKQEAEIHRTLGRKVPIQKVILTNNGKQTIKIDNKNYVIKEYFEGKTIDDGRKQKIEIIKQIGRYLALIHKTKFNFPLKNKNLIKKIQDFYSKIDKNSREYYVSSKVLNYLKNEGFEKAKFPKGLIHIDLHGGNYIIKDNKIQAVLDFDEAGLEAYIFDIGLCIYDFAMFKDLNKKRMNIFIRSYEKIRKLTKEEKKHIINAVIFMGIHSLHYLIKKNGTNKYNFNEFFIKKYIGFLKRRKII